MIRSLLLPFTLPLCLAAQGQWCFTVTDATDGRPVPGCALILRNKTIAFSDSSGHICWSSQPQDSVQLRGIGRIPRSVAAWEIPNGSVVKLETFSTELPAVHVDLWPRRKDRYALAAVATADSALLADFERSSLRSAVQWLPGVQWDERGHGGSMRLSIRGSLLRSPYGVRGVKVYWGPFPLTLADGSTPLEVLDPLLADHVDVVRSVGSPVYGTAPSGLLLAQAPFNDRQGWNSLVEATGGSYGYYRLGVRASTGDENGGITVGLLRQRNDGYRAQEWSARDQAFIASRWMHKTSSAQMYITFQDASWALPGSLDSLTAATDPRSARPYSEQIDAHIDKQQVMAGLATEAMIGKHLVVRSGVHAQAIDKVNPYGTSAAQCGFKDETIRAAGARASLGGDALLFQLPFAWELGAEALLERDRLEERTYVDAVEGALRTDADTRVGNMNVFAMTTLRVAPKTTVHAGFGMERSQYKHSDDLLGTTSNFSPDAALYPNVGIETMCAKTARLHLRYAESVSRPTVWELLGTSGIYNKELGSEHVREIELGAATTDTSWFGGDVQFYYRSTEELILAQLAADSVNTEYVNVGQAWQYGAEALAHVDRRLSAQWNARVLLSITAQLPQLDAQGHNDPIETPGVERSKVGLLLHLDHASGVSLEAGWRISSDVAASTTTDARIPGYQVWNARVGYGHARGNSRLDLFISCENLLDRRYTGWVQINDPGKRYYNPAPGRSFFGGVRLTFSGHGTVVTE